MNSYLLANKAIQYGVSLTLYFLLLAMIVEFSIKAFRIQNHRFKASVRFLTLLNIVLSPLLLLLPKKWVFVNTNIFGCAHPFQKFCFNLLYTHCDLYGSGVYGVNTVLGKWLLPIPMSILSLVLIIALSISIYRLSALCVSYFNARKKFKSIQKNGSLNLKPIENLKLARNLIKYRTTILISKETQVPFAGFGNRIVIPAHLLKILSQAEYEAIISHELEHIIWKDGITRAFCQIIASIFWWIPIKNWLLGLVHEQELACDHVS